MKVINYCLSIMILSFSLSGLAVAGDDFVIGGYDPGTSAAAQSQMTQMSQKDLDAYGKSLFYNDNDPVMGKSTAPITVVEFFDYRCPHCQDMGNTLEDIVKDNPNVRVVFKEFPIMGNLSKFASKAALAAKKQGKYLALHNAILALKTDITEDSILEKAKEVGLNVDQLKTDMDSDGIENMLASNRSLGSNLQLAGTPGFYVKKANSSSALFIAGEVSQSFLQNAINQVKAAP